MNSDLQVQYAPFYFIIFFPDFMNIPLDGSVSNRMPLMEYSVQLSVSGLVHALMSDVTLAISSVVSAMS